MNSSGREIEGVVTTEEGKLATVADEVTTGAPVSTAKLEGDRECGWFSSSYELACGLVVKDGADTIPGEFLDEI